MTKIIILTGKAQSGKDTSCEVISKYLSDKYPNAMTKKYSFADDLKVFCSKMFNVPLEKLYGSNDQKNEFTEVKWVDLPLPKSDITKFKAQFNTTKKFLTIRQLLIMFGTHICRKMYFDCWANALKNVIQSEGMDYALICDARYPNEIDIFEDPNTYVIRLTRNLLNIKDVSERALDKYDFTLCSNPGIIINDSMTLEQKNEAVLAIAQDWNL